MRLRSRGKPLAVLQRSARSSGGSPREGPVPVPPPRPCLLPPGRCEAPALPRARRSEPMASPAVGPCPRPLPGPSAARGAPTGSPGGAKAARRLRRRGGAPRLLPDVRSIFAAPREPPERGRGHRFAPRLPRRGWCDLCGEAVRERALRCDCSLETTDLEQEDDRQLTPDEC
ncbi:LOW QUALITY PROTEIN: ras association domain-containing protein 5-like [Chamaea fasciata]|uniref:LOW QUALITY PROTEIN: ras association domain-containing protein 5-like n=1 Tax=Chamaea fasciata TaxID=190680 RepID=UPI00336AC017